MYNTEQIIKVDHPEYVTFRGVISSGRVTTKIGLTNITQKPVFYKVKTTKPDRYCVNPSHGVLDGGDNIDLSVKLRERHLTEDSIKYDKFMVQSIHVDKVPDAEMDAFKAFQLVTRKEVNQIKLHVLSENMKMLLPENDVHVDSGSFGSARNSDENIQNNLGESDGNDPKKMGISGAGGQSNGPGLGKDGVALDKNGNPERDYQNGGINGINSRGNVHDVSWSKKLMGMFANTFGFNNKGDANQTERCNYTCILYALLGLLLGIILGYIFRDWISLTINYLKDKINDCAH